MDNSWLWFWTLTLQVAALVKFLFLLLCWLRSRKSFPLAFACRTYSAQLRQWWSQKHPADSRCEQELGKMRCKWMRIVLRSLFLVFFIVRLVPWQVSYIQGVDSEMADDFYFTALVVSTLSFVLGFFPFLITPRTLDVWYVLIVLCIDSTFVFVGAVDARDMIVFTFAGRFMFAVLAKRTWCVVLCILANLLTAIQLSQSQEASGMATSVQSLIGTYIMLFLCIMGVRILIRENVLLKVDLQKRTVETGAVSSLLTACYDAVVEVDHELKLTHDSNQLSSMLLYAPRSGGLSGKSLLEFFSETDRSRISEQFLTSTMQKWSVVALNADMLDSDFNHVKVELFSAQFKNLAEEQCFLVAVREMQDVEALRPASRPADSLSVEGNVELVVIYDVFTFDIYLMDREMEHFCKAFLGDSQPDNILDLASPNSRLFLSQQLQKLGNQLFTTREGPTETLTVNFNLLGLGEATASVSAEHDQLLDSWTGTMAIEFKASQPLSSGLTASDLQSLPEDDGPGHSFGRTIHRHRSRSSSSRRSRSSRSRSQRSGAISELHQRGRSIPL